MPTRRGVLDENAFVRALGGPFADLFHACFPASRALCGGITGLISASTVYWRSIVHNRLAVKGQFAQSIRKLSQHIIRGSGSCVHSWSAGVRRVEIYKGRSPRTRAFGVVTEIRRLERVSC